MTPILSACLVMYHCGDETDLTLRCIQNADLEVSVFLSDNSPEELTAERLKWAFPGVVVLSHEKNIGLSRAHNAVLPHLQSKYHLLLDPGISFHPSLLRRMVSYMEAHSNIAVLTPRFFSEEGKEIFFPRRLPASIISSDQPFRGWAVSLPDGSRNILSPTRRLRCRPRWIPLLYPAC